MRYLYIDIDLAIKYVNRKESQAINCQPWNDRYCKLIEYKQKLAIMDHRDTKGFKNLCRNFDSFVKRHNILY
jgi:hypothetical protein